MTGLPTEYGKLTHELTKRAAAIKRPINGTFELTERCNLKCDMCYVCQPLTSKYHRSSELSASSWVDVAHQAVDNGMLFLLLTGGEVFIRPDFFEIFTPLTKMGLMLTLFTNGTLITENIAKRLAEAPPSRIEVTLYGATAKTYEKITGVSGSFDRCCAGIEFLVKNRLPLSLKTVLTRYNIDELEAMRKMAHNWGLLFSAGWLLSGRRDETKSEEVEHCRLTAAKCVELELSDQASSSEWNEIALRAQPNPSYNNFYCYAGRAAFVISAKGEMNTCLDLPMPGSLPLEIGFQKAWEKVTEYVDKAPPMSPICRSCESLSYCVRCPAWSNMEAGNLTEPVSYLCEIAHLRKERYGKKL